MGRRRRRGHEGDRAAAGRWGPEAKGAGDPPPVLRWAAEEPQPSRLLCMYDVCASGVCMSVVCLYDVCKKCVCQWYVYVMCTVFVNV